MNMIDLMHMDTELLSIEKFIALSEKERQKIRSIKIVPPEFGSLNDDDFGKVCIKYKAPIYKMKAG